MENVPKLEGKSAIFVSTMLPDIFLNRFILVLAMSNTCVHEEAYSFEDQMTIIDSVVKLIILEVVHPLKTLLGIFHGN
jgi:hypothetical protein